MRFTASFRRSELSWPGNLKQHVTPDMVADIKWFKSPTANRENMINKTPIMKFPIQEEKRAKKLTARSGEFECSEANIIERLVVKNHTLVRILYKLMNRQSGVVRLHDSVRDLGRWEDGEGHQHPIGVFFSDL